MNRLASSLSGLSLALSFALSATASCSSGGGNGYANDASTGPVLSGSPDAGSFVFEDDGGAEASVLLSACNPSNPNSCPTGFICYTQHTSAAWWVDLYGTCTFDCNGQTYSACDSLGGVCGCPVPQGATSGDCSLDGGASMVCVPGLKPGTSPGGNEGDGGCGTPGCAGGPPVEAGPVPADAGSE